MPDVVSAPLVVKSQRFAIVVGRFNEFITTRLLDGATDALRRHGADDGQITQVWVPGAWELPVAAKALAQTGRFDAIICLGCVIRGQTPHFEHVAAQAARGISQVAYDTGVPVSFGVLTTDTIEQAVERAGTKSGNKGADAAICAIEMSGVLSAIRALKK